MKIMLYSLSSFSLAWLVHFAIWRIAQPQKHTRALLVIFMSVLLGTLLLEAISILPALTGVEITHFTIFYIPAMLAYICFYSAIEEDSPSMSLIDLTKYRKKCHFSDYSLLINNNSIVDSRLSAMVRDGLLTENDKQYYITSKGFFWGKLFKITYQFLHLKDGG